MADWNSAQYLKFEAQRTQPAIDLARRMELESPGKIADIGCGPGNSTRVLGRLFPQAEIVGFDSSENMLERARRDCPEFAFRLCDASKDLPSLGSDFDAVFSNACLQWVPDHPKRLPELLGMLKKGGTLAVQIPMNFEEPVHTIIGELAGSPKWRSRFPRMRPFYTLTPGEYYELLAEHASSFELWQTTYFHILPSHGAILEWYRSTGLRPYLDLLEEDERPAFEADFLAAVKKAYPAQRDGNVIFRFPRFFFTAVR